MKRFLYLLFSIPVMSFAQNWQNICSPGKTIFLSADSKYAAFRLDSVIFQSGDSVYYSYMAFRDTSSNYMNPSCVDTTEGLIFGRKIIRHPDGIFNFFNRHGDTLFLKTTSSLNQTWKMFSLPNNCYLEAKVTGKAMETFLGISDSVKTITLQAKDNLNNPINHQMNGKILKHSKSYGLILFYDAYFFPDETPVYTLAGKSNPELGFHDPVAYKIYDWPVGAIFHYKDDGGLTKVEKSNAENLMRPPHYSYHTYTIKTILQKTLTPDSCSYTCHICSLTTEGYTGYEDTTIINNTATEVYNFNTAGTYLNKLEDEFNPSGHLYTLKIGELNSAPAIVIYDNCFFRPDCWYLPSNFPHDYSIKSFSDNLGMIEKNTFVFYGSPNFTTHYELVYYSYDTLTWGTPLYADCDALLSLNTDKKCISRGIRIVPNPVDKTAVMEIPYAEQINQLAFCLYDEMGKKLKCQPVLHNSFLFDRENFGSGLYFYSLIDRDGKILSSGKVMLK
jgi:hypothetical protein